MFFALPGIGTNSTASLPHLKPRSRARTFETPSQIVLHWFWHRADSECMTGKSQGKVCRPTGSSPYGGLRFSGLPITSRKTALLSLACGEKKLITSSSKKVSPVAQAENPTLDASDLAETNYTRDSITSTVSRASRLL